MSLKTILTERVVSKLTEAKFKAGDVVTLVNYKSYDSLASSNEIKVKVIGMYPGKADIVQVETPPTHKGGGTGQANVKIKDLKESASDKNNPEYKIQKLTDDFIKSLKQRFNVKELSKSAVSYGSIVISDKKTKEEIGKFFLSVFKLIPIISEFYDDRKKKSPTRIFTPSKTDTAENVFLAYGKKLDEFELLLKDTLKTPVKKETGLDKSSGSPFDRGAADSYYNRGTKPHYIDKKTNKRVEQKDMTEDEIDAYYAGYEENEKLGDKKRY